MHTVIFGYTIHIINKIIQLLKNELTYFELNTAKYVQGIVTLNADEVKVNSILYFKVFEGSLFRSYFNKTLYA